ncbi:MAG: 30S ribosomal protein S4 [Chitinophagales bacterium]|jgi:small subunit ribosomal protein S4|nr:30S ribosomal protein S4 [Chitinophagales bacterium]
MARYIGPKTKISRKFSEEIYGYDKYFQKRKYAPGQHGPSKRRKQPSDYAVQLMEKQKAKYIYGLLERQFEKTFKKALSKQGVTGEVLLQLLEARLDNTVYRMGFCKTRAQARQVVLHKHVLVNGKIVNIPSYSLKPNDVIEIREQSKSLELISTSLANTERKFTWLQVDPQRFTGAFLNYPNREDIPEKINEQYIVELYSK